ncbi:hypothetical protein CEXT_664381 [Caerostris extrusa]|uniref:Uncharacterized protein n=1 Tax=Caerostris extrusa TaxID=172846 RepID=A0AAV4X129_CAEEX|nr:hypothetical protein CEXT_664381 [Caerostris extrusa]
MRVTPPSPHLFPTPFGGLIAGKRATGEAAPPTKAPKRHFALVHAHRSLAGTGRGAAPLVSERTGAVLRGT